MYIVYKFGFHRNLWAKKVSMKNRFLVFIETFRLKKSFDEKRKLSMKNRFWFFVETFGRKKSFEEKQKKFRGKPK